MQMRNMTSKGRVIILDPEFATAHATADRLRDCGFEPELCATQDAAIQCLEIKGADVIVADLRVVGRDSMDLLDKLHKKNPDVAVVVSVPGPAKESAKAALRGGAFDYLTKPFEVDDLNAVVSRAVEMSTLQRENRRLREQLEVACTAAGFIAESRSSRDLVATIRRVAPSRSTALIEGETGTGKELVARLLHYWSDRSNGPFVAINCKAFGEGVVESELFGHEKGSFTGAIRDRAGCFERASGGTLFLDEVAEAGADFQAKLLRVLEDGEVLRVGASKSRKVDVRIVAATNRKLKDEVAAGRFRADLYFRLDVIPLRVAPLRDRAEDILPLANHFLAFHRTENGRPLALSPDAEQSLLKYSWPGNVRELENVIERAVVMSGADVLTAHALALEEEDIKPRAELRARPADASPVEKPNLNHVAESALSESATAGTLQECLDAAATVRIKAALAAADGNRIVAASALGVDRTTLYRLMKRLGL